MAVIATRDATLTVRAQPLGLAVEPGSLRFSDAGFHLNLKNLTGAGPVLIEASDDLQNWQPILTNPPATGTWEAIDPEAPWHARRFYRASEGGQ